MRHALNDMWRVTPEELNISEIATAWIWDEVLIPLSNAEQGTSLMFNSSCVALHMSLRACLMYAFDMHSATCGEWQRRSWTWVIFHNTAAVVSICQPCPAPVATHSCIRAPWRASTNPKWITDPVHRNESNNEFVPSDFWETALGNTLHHSVFGF